MAYWPPGIPSSFPPPPRRPLSPPPPPWRPPPSPPRNDNSSSSGGIVAGLVIAIMASLLIFAIGCALCQGYRNSRAAAGAAARARAARPPPPPRDDGDEVQLRGASEGALPRRASPTAGLLSFTYSRPAKHNVSAGGEEAAATCSVCLGAFQLGEAVRLLPVCLHLYHVECIDPWLDAHSTCPLCRSGTDPTIDVVVGRLPPV